VESFDDDESEEIRIVRDEDNIFHAYHRRTNHGPKCTEENDIHRIEDLDEHYATAHNLSARHTPAGEERPSLAVLLFREIEASEQRTLYHLELSRAPTRPSSRLMIANENVM
jgi:hypothetical protein